MSTYVMSDIHGDMTRFEKALERVEFDQQKDTLYVIGDIVDRGEYGVDLLRYAMENQEWLHLLLGNHEMFLRRFLNGGNGDIKLERSLYESWEYGGSPTVKKTGELNFVERYQIIKFLRGLSLYEVIDTPNGKTVLTHSGLSANHLIYHEDGKISVIDSIEEGYAADEFDFLVSCDLHYLPAEELKKLDFPMIVGHTPCRYLNENGSNQIFHGINYMCIDGGCGYPEDKGELAVYRVEDGKKWYI